MIPQFGRRQKGRRRFSPEGAVFAPFPRQGAEVARARASQTRRHGGRIARWQAVTGQPEGDRRPEHRGNELPGARRHLIWLKTILIILIIFVTFRAALATLKVRMLDTRAPSVTPVMQTGTCTDQGS